MTVQMQPYSMINLSNLLPISDRDSVLKWFKARHEEAMTAELYGQKNTVIIETEFLSVTSDQLLMNIDTVSGSISTECARMLVDIVTSGGIPESLMASHPRVDSQFLAYAYSA